ncbi:MAG: response regulator [Gallionellaceae bacterium]|nr:response regulator [Gallionellaceae bacterium]
MRSFFYPSIALMNRLSYTRKFALLGLISLVAIAVVVYSLLASLNQVIYHSQKELDGIALIRPISRTVQFTQQHRGLSAALLGGSEAMRGWRASKEKETDDVFNAMEEKLNSIHPSSETSEGWRQIKVNWENLQKSGLNLTVAENFAAHTRLINQILLLEVSIADEYMLTLDPEISTFYLIDTTVKKLPHVIEHLGEIRAYGTGILAQKKISSSQKAYLENMLAELGNALKLLNANIGKANRYDTVTRDALLTASNAIADSAQRITERVKSDILTGRLDTRPEDYMLIATKAINSGYEQIYESLLPATEVLLKARIEQAKKTLYTSAALAILLFLIAAYFAIGIYKAITGSIESLANSARAFTSGDMRERVNISAHDELSQIGDSFNEMADGFSAMLSKVTQREQEILRINAELEERVAERTAKLTESNEAMAAANNELRAIQEELTASNENLRQEAIERELLEKLLREREGKLRAYLDNISDTIWIINANLGVDYASPSVVRLLGVTPKELIGRPSALVIHPDDMNAVTGAQHYVMQHPGEPHTVQYRVSHKDGHWIYVESTGVNMLGNPAINGVLIAMRDITERKHIEHELQEAMFAAAAASRAKGDFLANMSHEIRTPMNAIIGLSNLCMQTEPTPKQSDYLQKIHSSAKSLLGIINDILDFSKIEAGKIGMEQMRFELEDVMNNLATVISTKAEEKGLELLFEIPSNVYPSFIGDPLRLGQVLINLAGNAVKFTEKGEVLVLAEVDQETPDDVVLRFTIRDSGIGMTQEQAGKIFQAFTQADTTTTRKFGGTGLGLSISKQLVELMNGKIWVESTPGTGSKFIFTARFGKVTEQHAWKGHLPHVDLQGMRVLAVDDNATCRHILQSYLESFTLNITTVNNGLEALQTVEQADRDGAPYRFVVLDWKMPGMDGIEVAQNIHEMTGLSKTPKILLISAFSQSEMLRHLEGHMVDGILTKPFQQSDLFNTIVGVCGNSEDSIKRNALSALFHHDLVAKISGAYLLLAEDNEINQQVARELLGKAGVTVAIANNGKEAIARLWEEKFDGVLMDMQMPVMDGLTATREIRKNPRLANLPIIAITANVMKGDREQCLAAGMNDRITKPLDPNQMIETLAKWIVPAQPADLPPAHGLKTLQGHEALPNLPGVRVGEGVRRMCGSIAGYYAILEKFRNNQQNTLAEIRSAIAANDWEKSERLAHTLKGLLGTLGAGKLKVQAAKLEAALRERNSRQFESLFPAIDLDITQLFAAIDQALKLRAAEKIADVAAADNPVDIDELTNLIHLAKSQLEEFDSNAENTVAKISRMAGGDAAMKKAMASIGRHIGAYQYEQGLIELVACAKSMNILRT